MVNKIKRAVVLVLVAVLMAGSLAGCKRDQEIFDDLKSETQRITQQGSFVQDGAIRQGVEVLKELGK